MTSETDYSRQRTVAELLAEHGGVPTGRRRRRHAADEPPDDVAAEQVDTVEPDRSVLREPVPPALGAGAGANGSRKNGAGSNGAGSNGAASNGAASEGIVSLDGGAFWDPPERGATLTPEPAAVEPAPAADLSSGSEPAGSASTGHTPVDSRPPVDWPTESIPLIADPQGRPLGPGGPIGRLQRATPRWRDALDAVERSERDLHATPVDEGAPTVDRMAPAAPERADPASADPWPPLTRTAAPFEGVPDVERDGALDATDVVGQRHPDDDLRENPAGLDDAGLDLEPRPRFGRADADEAAVRPGWPLVIAQWVLGALGGAALWVGFRVLWHSLPVVALAAAILVTVGLVVLVRTLLRSNDARTTAFAVLVGLLLTVSPAILVLLDR